MITGGKTGPKRLVASKHRRVGIAGNMVSPILRLSPEYRKQAGNPQGKLLEERVEDDGKSECRVVMARIRIQDLS